MISVILLGILLSLIAFFITRSLTDTVEKPESTMQRIRKRGYLLAGMETNTLGYFIYRGEAVGYQLELLESFSKSVGIPLKIVVAEDIKTLARLVEYKAIDLLASNLPITPDGKKISEFTKSFGDTRLVLVQNRNSGRHIGEPTDFNQDTVFIAADPYLRSLVRKFLGMAGGRVTVTEIPGTSREELITRVAEGAIGLTMCEENLAMVLKRIYPQLDVGYLTSRLYPYAWAIPSGHSDTLRRFLNVWMDSIRKEQVLKKIYIEYYGSQKTVNYFQNRFSSLVGGQISPFDKELKNLSKLIRWDWRLVASLMYEESNFRTGQVSHRNASGLMQMIPETAEKFGLDSTSGPTQQIAAGIRYLGWIDKQIPASIQDLQERHNFILAAYNVGIGRVLSAREKAENFGKDPDRWTGNVEYYLLKRSRKDPYGQQDSSSVFPVDYHTEGYVDKIMTRFSHYRNLIPL